MDASLKCRRLDPSSIRSVEGDAEWKLYNAGLMRAHFLKYLGCFGSSIPAAVGLMGIFLQVKKKTIPPFNKVINIGETPGLKMKTPILMPFC